MSSQLACLDLLDRLVLGGQVHQGNLDPGGPWVTQVYKERRVPEGFLAFLAFQDLLAAVDPRETGEVTVTPDVPALGWRGPGVPRVLMAPRDLRELGNLDLRVSEAPPGNKVCEEWLEGPGLLGRLATASSVKPSGCKRTLEDRRKDKQINDQMDILPALNGLRFRNGLTGEYLINTEHATPHQITAQVVTLDSTQCLSLLIIIFIICCDTEYKQTL